MTNKGADTDPDTTAAKRQPRQSRLVKAAFSCERFGRFDITVRNVSETGLGGQAPHALFIGERVTVYLPGHAPMMGTVRWVVERRFGVETDVKIEPGRLRTASGEQLVAADSSLEFQLFTPPQTTTWRPGLTIATNLPGHFGRKR
jgi:hypothetical protein